MKTIPLPAGLSYIRLNVTLGDLNLQLRLRWSTQYGFYSVEIRDERGEPIILGRGLHPGTDLLTDLRLDAGRLILEGEVPTVQNLGLTNKLNWYPDE